MRTTAQSKDPATDCITSAVSGNFPSAHKEKPEAFLLNRH
jgi:hypothetical protein